MNIEETKLEELKKRFEEIKDRHDFQPDEDLQKYLDDFIDENFGAELEKEMNASLSTRKLFVKRLHEDAVLPFYNYTTDSGFDLYSVEEVILPPFGRALIPTGLSFEFEENLEIQVRPKSGLAINQGLTVLNTPGTVDQGFRGEIKVIVFNTNNTTVTIKKGMKVAQAVLCPVLSGKYVSVEEVDNLDETDRNNNGFGSTGLI